MTMATATRNRIGSQTPINTDKFAVLQPMETKAILLPDGWHNIENPEKVEFAVEEAHSPAELQKSYTSLRFTENGQEVIVPLRQVLGYSNTNSKYAAGSNPSSRQQFGTASQS